MKRLLVLALVSAFVSIAASAGEALPPKAYTGLYADGSHSVKSVYYAGSPTPFTFWIWWLPGSRGLMAAEFTIVYPSNISVTSTVSNPYANPMGCSLQYGVCSFPDCRIEWVWTHRQTCILNDAGPGIIEIVANPSAGALQIANCEAGYPLEPATVLNHLSLNQPGVIAVENFTWGAIKSLYR